MFKIIATLLVCIGLLGCATQPDMYLSNSTYKSITFEVISVEGYEIPTMAPIVKQFMEYCNKSQEPVIIYDSPISIREVKPQKWHDIDVSLLKHKYAKKSSSGSNLVVYILSLPGNYYDGPASTAAYTNWPDTVVYFKDVAKAAPEKDIILHEFCHLLGLVNNGTPMKNNHENRQSSGHCKYEGCIMFPVQNGSSSLCQDCLKDIGK